MWRWLTPRVWLRRVRIAALVAGLGVAVHSLPAQYVTHGPVVGALTASSCKMYLRTAQCGKVIVEFSTDENLEHSFSASGVTDSLRDKSVMLYIQALQPDTRYFFRVLFEGWEDSIRGSFRTFPAEGQRGDFTFVTGSCQETADMKVFDVIPRYQPYFLMHTGDFTYPDYQIKPDYSNTMDTVAYSYRKRYDEKVMKQMLYHLPIDYVYDDNDYVGGSGGRYCKNDWKAFVRHGKVINEMYADTFPDRWRRNVIQGYDQYFPHYELPDTSEGIFHSFVFGNAEFFVLDRNSAKALPNRDAFRYDAKKKRWVFDPPPGYALFGPKQMEWLKQGLKASKADWKFIVSGVPFNGACKKLIDAGVKLQQMHYKNWFGFHIAWGFAQYFAGYPEERNELMNFIRDNHIANVLVISGDTHHNVMDDGRHAGLPELNASGLSVETTELAHYLRLIGNLTGLYHMRHIWNRGGNGLKGERSKNAFGKIRIVGNRYVELSIVDEDDHVVSSFKVPYQP